jgi:hypothetical protein
MMSDREPSDAFVMIPIGHGTLAPGAVGAMLEQARGFALEGRRRLLADYGLPSDPEGDVIMICCAKGDAHKFGNQIVAAVADTDTIRGD